VILVERLLEDASVWRLDWPRVAIHLSETELHAWQALLHAHHMVTRTLDGELQAKHGLSFGEYDVLLRLARAQGPGLRMSELAERVMLSPSGLTRLVDRLVDDGLVQRDRFEGDARVMLARLTDRGRRVLRSAAKTHLQGIREHFTGRLTEPELRNIAFGLEKITGPHEPH
jgi:DNA-binding MarR family transcriptional regulator